MQPILEKIRSYPYWRSGSILTIILIIIGCIGIQKLYSTSRSNANSKNNKENNVVLIELQKDRDTDEDGLPDWEEALYESDINRKDTDGDGTTDGEEVLKGRDPTKKGPKDKLAYLAEVEKITASSSTGISKEAMAKFFANQETALQKETMKKLVSEFDPSIYKPTYQVVDLNIGSSNDPDKIRTYINALGEISAHYATNVGYRNEEDVLTEAVAKKSSVILQELQYPAVGYRNFAKEIKDLSVPPLLSKYHIQIINGYDIMSRSLIEMQAMFARPIIGAGAYQVYMTNRFEVTKGFLGMMKILRDKNIVFTSTEGGYPFNPATSTPSIVK